MCKPKGLGITPSRPQSIRVFLNLNALKTTDAELTLIAMAATANAKGLAAEQARRYFAGAPLRIARVEG